MNKTPKLLKASLIYSFGNMLPQLVNFLLLPFYSRVLSPEDYGVIATVEMYIYIISIFMCLCLDRAAQRFFFDNECLDKRRIVLSTFFWTIILVSLSLSLALYLLKDSLPMSLSFPFYPFVAISIVLSLFNSFSLLTTVYFQLIEKPLIFTLLKLIRFIINIMFVLFMLLWVGANAQNKLLGDLYAVMLMLPIYLFIACKYFGFGFDWKILKAGFSFSIPFIPTLLVAWVLGMSNRFFIEKYLTLADVGFFSMAFKIASVAIILSSSIAVAFGPIFYKLANQEGKDSKTLYDLSLKVVYGTIVIVFVLMLFIPEVVNWFLDVKYHSIKSLIIILMFSNLLSSLMSFTTVLYIMQAKNTYFNLYAGLIASVFSLVINIIFIPIYGLHGAIMANVISMIVLAFVQNYFARKGFYIKLPWLYFSMCSTGLFFIAALSQLLPILPSVFISKVLILGFLGLLLYKFKDSNICWKL